MSVTSIIYEWLSTSRGELAQAGLIGSAVSSALEWAGWQSTVRRIIVGVGTAMYLSPTAASLVDNLFPSLKIPPENALATAGFLLGVGGIVVVEILLKLFRLKLSGFTKGNSTDAGNS